MNQRKTLTFEILMSPITAAGYCFCLWVHCIAARSWPVWVCWEGSMALVASGPFPLAQVGEGSQVEVNQFCEIWAELLKPGNCTRHHIVNGRFGKGFFMWMLGWLFFLWLENNLAQHSDLQHSYSLYLFDASHYILYFILHFLNF